jgi:predicted transposase/invertase (TIGR01784 family)
MFMKYRHEERAEVLIEQLCLKEAGIMRAEQAVMKVSRDYIRYAKKMAGIKNSMDRAQELLEAREEAAAEGLAEGLAQGLEKGRAESRTEKLEIARKMKEMGDPIEKIQIITGLSAETIERM